MNDKRKAKLIAGGVGIGLLLVFLLIGVALAYVQVPEGHQGVEKDWGAVNGQTLEPGANWIVPVMQDVQNVEVRPRTYTLTTEKNEGAKKDSDPVTVKTTNGSSVDVSVTIRYTIDDERADKFVTVWNNEEQMEKRLIRPTVKNNLQDEGSSLQTTGPGSIYTSEGREALRETTLKVLKAEVDGQPITIQTVQIRDIDLPKQIDNTLDDKEQAKQRVEVEKERVKQEEAKKEQQIVQAEANAKEKLIAAQADANATEIRGEALDEYPIVLRQSLIEQMGDGTVYLGATDSLALTKEVGANETGE